MDALYNCITIFKQHWVNFFVGSVTLEWSIEYDFEAVLYFPLFYYVNITSICIMKYDLEVETYFLIEKLYHRIITKLKNTYLLIYCTLM